MAEEEDGRWRWGCRTGRMPVSQQQGGGVVWLSSAGRVVYAEAGDMLCLLPRALAGVTALKFVGKWFCTWR